MTFPGRALVIILALCSFAGCADSRVQRSDEEAMMIYRDCMGSMPQQWDSGDVTAGLGSEHVASARAGADSRRDSRQHNECVQRAGWEE